MEAISTEIVETALDDSVTLWDYVSSQASALSLDLYDLDTSSGGKLRVFIEKVATESTGDEEIKRRGSGVTSDDCSRLVRKLVHGLAVHGPKLGVGSEPEIEVSSPGIERILRLPKHFQNAIGEKVKITSRSGFESGMLVGFDGREIMVRVGERDVVVVLEDIKKAQVEY